MKFIVIDHYGQFFVTYLSRIIWILGSFSVLRCYSDIGIPVFWESLSQSSSDIGIPFSYYVSDLG